MILNLEFRIWNSGGRWRFGSTALFRHQRVSARPADQPPPGLRRSSEVSAKAEALLARTRQPGQDAAPGNPRHQIALQLAQRPVPLRTGIGSAHDAVGTTSKQAQAFYDQGLAYLHSYVWLEAARSFNQALRLDPKLAMAHAGLTIAYTELNAPGAARAALERAKALAAGAHDTRHVELRALQMAAEAAPQDTAKLATNRSALDAALKAFPEDEELWLQRGQ